MPCPGSVIRMLKHEIALSRGTISKGILSSEVENAINERIVTLRKRRSSMQQAARVQQNVRELDNLLELKDKVIEYMTSWKPRRYSVKTSISLTEDFEREIALTETCVNQGDFSGALYHRMMADMAHRILKDLEME